MTWDNFSRIQLSSDEIGTNRAFGVDVANISGNTYWYWINLCLATLDSDGTDCQLTRTTFNIVQCKLANPWIELKQQGERLSNPSCGAKDSDLGGLARKISSARRDSVALGLHGMSTCLAEAENALLWTAPNTWRESIVRVRWTS